MIDGPTPLVVDELLALSAHQGTRPVVTSIDLNPLDCAMIVYLIRQHQRRYRKLFRQPADSWETGAVTLVANAMVPEDRAVLRDPRGLVIAIVTLTPHNR